jgi:hypothetical protein
MVADGVNVTVTGADLRSAVLPIDADDVDTAPDADAGGNSCRVDVADDELSCEDLTLEDPRQSSDYKNKSRSRFLCAKFSLGTVIMADKFTSVINVVFLHFFTNITAVIFARICLNYSEK